jgi:nitroreductase
MSDKKIIDNYPYIAYSKPGISDEEMIKRAQYFYTKMNERRSVRDFSNQSIPLEVIENIVKTASTAPSGAHKQPWTFCIIQNPEIKKQIRIEAEKEEYESYESRMSSEWINDLKPLGTDWHKPFLETAPYLIAIFKHSYEIDENNEKKNNYYVQESVGIATGFLLAAIHNAGLVALTHTPSPMNFLSTILNRPKNEKPFLLIPIGFPAKECWVPDIERKALTDIVQLY